MKRHEEDPLLKELLGGEEMSEFRRASLERGLGAVRNARRRRNVLRAAGMAVPLVLTAALFLHRLPERGTEPAPGPHSQAANSAPAGSESGSIAYISDDQLFALFPGHSLALIGAPGHQELVFLDNAADGRASQGL